MSETKLPFQALREKIRESGYWPSNAEWLQIVDEACETEAALGLSTKRNIDALRQMQQSEDAAFDRKAWEAWLRLVLPRYKNIQNEDAPLFAQAEGYDEAVDDCFQALAEQKPPFRIGVRTIQAEGAP